MQPPALAILQANDVTPGTVPKIPGASKVLSSSSDGKSATWVDPSAIGGLVGANAFSISTGAFTQPGVGSNVSVSVPTAWMVPGQPIFVQGGGNYTVASITSSSVAVLTNTGAAGNAAPGVVIGTSAQVAPAGLPGAAGTPGAAGATSTKPVRAVQTQILSADGTVFSTLWAFNAGAGTWTAPANGALPSPWNVFDNIATPAIGDRLLLLNPGTIVNSLTASVLGIYTITSLGSVSTPAVITRATDFNTSLALASATAFEVFDGAKTKNTRWQLTTQAPVLNTTPLVFAQVAPNNQLVVDLSQPPYNIRDFANTTDWIGAGRIDYFRAIDRFLWDHKSTPARGVLPSANGGIIFGIEPFDHYGNATLAGAGSTISQLQLYQLQGGFVASTYTISGSGTDGFPAIGPTVDTSSVNYSLSSYQGADAVARDYYYNLNQAGLFCNDWTQFECRMLVRFTEFVLSPVSLLISSRGRRIDQDAGDYGTSFSKAMFSIQCAEGSTKQLTAGLRLTDTTLGVYAAAVHTGGGVGTVVGNSLVKPTEDAASCTVKITASGTAGTAGVAVSLAVDGHRYLLAPTGIALGTQTRLACVHYTKRLANCDLAATANVATLSGEQTLDGVLTSGSRVLLAFQTTTSQNGIYRTGAGAWTREPDYNSDATIAAALFYATVITGGTTNASAGFAPGSMSNPGNGFVFSAGTTLAGAKTIQRARIIGPDVNELGLDWTGMFDFSGALVAGDTYLIACSGVNQYITLTSNTVPVINTNYDVCLQYFGGKVYFSVQVAGGTLDSSASATTGVAATGTVRQRYWEYTLLGLPANAGSYEDIFDFHTWHGYLGAIRFKSSSVSAISAVTTLYDGGYPTAGIAGQVLCWVPNATDVRLDAGGGFRKRYRATSTLGGNPIWIQPKAASTGAQPALGGYEGLTFSMGSSGMCGILSVAWRNRVFKDLNFLGGWSAMSITGPDFGSVMTDIQYNTNGPGTAFEFFQGGCEMDGSHNFNNCNNPRMMLAISATLLATGTLFMNGATTKAFCHLAGMLGSGRIDNLQIDAENQILHANGRELIRISISDGCSFNIRGAAFGAEVFGCITQVGAVSAHGTLGLNNLQMQIGVVPPLDSIGGAPPMLIGENVTNIGNLALPMTAAPGTYSYRNVAGVSLIADSNATLTFAVGTVQRAATNTWTANRTLTLSVTGMATGQIFEILIESQAGFTTTIVNGGAAAGTIASVPAATDRAMRFRLDETFNLVRVA